MFGPDGTGDFVIEKVSVEFSAQCDRNFCTCTDHEDYQMIANQRMKEAHDSTVKPETDDNDNNEGGNTDTSGGGNTDQNDNDGTNTGGGNSGTSDN